MHLGFETAGANLPSFFFFDQVFPVGFSFRLLIHGFLFFHHHAVLELDEGVEGIVRVEHEVVEDS